MDQPYARRQGAAELLGHRRGIRRDVVDQAGEAGGGSVVAQQVRADAIRHPQTAGEERPVGVLDDDQAPADERPTGLQPGAGGGRHRGLAGQLQRQPDRGASPGDVVVEVAVQPLEPAVQIRQQRDHQQLDVQRGQAGGPGEPAQPQSSTARLGGVGLGVEGGPGFAVERPDGRRFGGEQLLDGLLADVQATERIVRGRIAGPALRHQLTHPHLDELGPAEQVGEVRSRHGRFLVCRVRVIATRGPGRPFAVAAGSGTAPPAPRAGAPDAA